MSTQYPIPGLLIIEVLAAKISLEINEDFDETHANLQNMIHALANGGDTYEDQNGCELEVSDEYGFICPLLDFGLVEYDEDGKIVSTNTIITALIFMDRPRFKLKIVNRYVDSNIEESFSCEDLLELLNTYSIVKLHSHKKSTPREILEYLSEQNKYQTSFYVDDDFYSPTGSTTGWNPNTPSGMVELLAQMGLIRIEDTDIPNKKILATNPLVIEMMQEGNTTRQYKFDCDPDGWVTDAS